MPASEPLALHPSVITSSSVLPLSQLFRTLAAMHGPLRFDLMVLRPEDADRFGLASERIADLVADHFDTVRDGFDNEFEQYQAWAGVPPISLAALATYFPEVCCIDEAPRRQAVKALANCVRLCNHFQERFGGLGPGWAMDPCIEMVCGSLLEPWAGNIAANSQWAVQYARQAKIERIVRSLAETRDALAKDSDKACYCFAVELEPGDAYVVNDCDSLELLFKEIDKADLAGIVGLNLDIAHFRISGITAQQVRESGLAERIVHAHIADHPPGMHTRDLALGTFTDVESRPNGFTPYIALLRERADNHRRDPGRLPFTGAVALELEGCSRIGWIDSSIPHLKRLLA